MPSGLLVDPPSAPTCSGDASNRPARAEGVGVWPTRILDPQLVDRFGRAFAAGLPSPASPPTANEWLFYIHVRQIEPDAELRTFLAARAQRVFASAAGGIYASQTLVK
jgi:hypothetical protein